MGVEVPRQDWGNVKLIGIHDMKRVCVATGKKVFEHDWQAQDSINKIHSDKKFRKYQCEDCGFWHLTTMAPETYFWILPKAKLIFRKKFRKFLKTK